MAPIQYRHGVRLRIFEYPGDGRRQLGGGRDRGARQSAGRGGACDREGCSFFYGGNVGRERASFARNRVLPIRFARRNDYLDGVYQIKSSRSPRFIDTCRR